MIVEINAVGVGKVIIQQQQSGFDGGDHLPGLAAIASEQSLVWRLVSYNLEQDVPNSGITLDHQDRSGRPMLFHHLHLLLLSNSHVSCFMMIAICFSCSSSGTLSKIAESGTSRALASF